MRGKEKKGKKNEKLSEQNPVMKERTKTNKVDMRRKKERKKERNKETSKKKEA